MTGGSEQKAVSSKTLGRNSMRKKIILFALCAMFLSLCYSAWAQQTGKIYRIGFLSGGFPGPSHWTARMRAELQRIGYVRART
jgi:hypothetical protein